MFTVILQTVLFSISLRVALLSGLLGLLLAISCASLDFQVPAMLQNLLITSGGGGGAMAKAYHGAQLARSIRVIFPAGK